MVEETIATYLASNTSLTKGVDLFLADFPPSTREGVVLRLLNIKETSGTLAQANLIIMVFKKDYITGRDLSLTIISTLNNVRGSLDGSWTPFNEIKFNDYGKDELDRYNFTVSCPITF